MTCQACGCKEEIMIHGHYQCAACGRMNYECCQGETEVAEEKNIELPKICNECWNYEDDHKPYCKRLLDA